ncbi:hypothetical protein [Jannaschia sp. M317]|uniref:hypothetical protein n=1 Tax=Jannaschia sp. M317 TaxID=2867011 RepID=UPI0021A775C0|nr:hypothetical protein [Jannaschia sp. M317]UWQ16368.1 hypothetical protein K3551_10565 [Jannaschia sp. M317]
MKAVLAIALTALSLAAPAQAQQQLGYYFAEIGPQDVVNSRGARLGSVCAILQQDRANVHRFGRRDRSDEIDPFFGDRAARGIISQDCRPVYPGDKNIQRLILNGTSPLVRVQIWGRPGRIQFVTYENGAG